MNRNSSSYPPGFNNAACLWPSDLMVTQMGVKSLNCDLHIVLAWSLHTHSALGFRVHNGKALSQNHSTGCSGEAGPEQNEIYLMVRSFKHAGGINAALTYDLHVWLVLCTWITDCCLLCTWHFLHFVIKKTYMMQKLHLAKKGKHCFLPWENSQRLCRMLKNTMTPQPQCFTLILTLICYWLKDVSLCRVQSLREYVPLII